MYRIVLHHRTITNRIRPASPKLLHTLLLSSESYRNTTRLDMSHAGHGQAVCVNWTKNDQFCPHQVVSSFAKKHQKVYQFWYILTLLDFRLHAEASGQADPQSDAKNTRTDIIKWQQSTMWPNRTWLKRL